MTIGFSPIRGIAATFTLLLLCTAPAGAHHVMDSEIPQTFWQGLVSGLAHPVIGFDHLAMVVATGVVAALLGGRALLPLIFVAATIGGVVICLQGIELPFAEWVITLGILATGFSVASQRAISFPVYAIVFALTGLFHGFAYGESIIGSQPPPLLAYFLGFSLVQFAVAIAAMMLFAPHRYGEQRKEVSSFVSEGAARLMDRVPARLCGATIFGVALAIGLDWIVPA